ncbi:MAG: CPBP family intramembrane glutamic endopeptidase [Halanaerobiales bacterium]
MEEDKLYPGIKGTIILFLLGAAVNFFTSVFLLAIIGMIMSISARIQGEAVEGLVKGAIEASIGYVSMGALIITAVVLLVITLNKREQIFRYLLLENYHRINKKLLLIVAICAGGLTGFASGLNHLVFYFFELPLNNIEMMYQVIHGIQGFILALIIAPIFEELIFRGIFLRGLDTHIASWKAVLISSVLFTVLHANTLQIIPPLLFGLFVGYLYVKFKSIALCIFAHFAFNVIPYINYQIIEQDELDMVTEITRGYFIYYLLSTLVFIAGLVILKKYIENRTLLEIRKEKIKEEAPLETEENKKEEV